MSRLRGHVNVRGVNDWPYRRVRRAGILRRAVETYAPGLLDEKKRIPEERMTDAFIDQLLAVGRYRHGARSLEALVEVSAGKDPKEFSDRSLPKRAFHTSYVDAGPLDGLVLALSAGGLPRGDGGTGDYGVALEEAWPRVATRLLELGAGLVYGGDLRRGGFTESLAEASMRLPNPLVPDPRPRVRGPGTEHSPFLRPGPGRVTWVRAGTGPWAEVSLPERVDEVRAPPLSEAELAELGLAAGADLDDFDRTAMPAGKWKASPAWCRRLGNALALFRMRALVTRFADAHLLFGGRVKDFTGRFPGIAEEAMLSLAAGNAVYVCGGFGGAAREVGRVLGLDEPWSVVPDALRRDTHGAVAALLEDAVGEWGARFQLARPGRLPLTYAELVAFLRKHAVDGPRWPYNGLSPEENRVLFRSTDAREILELVERGLARRAAAAPG